MAESMFSNVYDARQKDLEGAVDYGASLAALPRGRVSVAVAGQSGGMLGQGLSSLAGALPPEQAQQAKMDELMSRFPNPTTYEDYMAIAGEFMTSGMQDMGEYFLKLANDMKDSSTSDTMSTHAKRMDVASKGVGCNWRMDGKDCYQKTQRAAAKLQGDEGYKANEKAKVDLSTESGDLLSTYSKQLANINQQASWLDEGVRTGWATNTFLGINRALGMDVASEEAFLASTRQGNLEDLSAMSGAVSDKDIEVVQQANAQLGNSVEGNLMILKVKKLFLKNAQAQERYIQTFIENNPEVTMSGINIKKEEWRQSNPIGLATKDEFKSFRTGKYDQATGVDKKANLLQDAKDNINNLIEQAKDRGY